MRRSILPGSVSDGDGSWPRVTVLTVARDAEATIADCIDSVSQQSYANIEHIIVDGASVDATLSIVKSRVNKGATVISEPDVGIYDALNKGLGLATGDVVGFLHSDDFFSSGLSIEKIAAAFKAKAVDAVYGDLEFVRSTDTTRVVRRWHAGAFAPGSLRWGWMPPHPTLYARRHIYRSIGGFDIRFRIAADYRSVLEMFNLEGFSASYIPEVLVRMRTGGVSNRSLRNIAVKMSEDYRALRDSGHPVLESLFTLTAKNLRKTPQLF